MKRIGLTLTMLLFTLASASRAEPYYTYNWPCSGNQFGNAPLIYEAAFPNAHPGLDRLKGMQFTTELITSDRKGRLLDLLDSKFKKRRATVEAVVVVVNRRGNREGGEELFRTISDANHNTSILPLDVKLREGDMVKVGITCTMIGKLPKRVPRVKYTLDFFGHKAD